jgi:hypothetical protein
LRKREGGRTVVVRRDEEGRLRLSVRCDRLSHFLFLQWLNNSHYIWYQFFNIQTFLIIFTKIIDDDFIKYWCILFIVLIKLYINYLMHLKIYFLFINITVQ